VKILFVPYYYYLQYIPFKMTIKELLGRGIDAEILYIPNMAPKDESQNYNPQRFIQDEVPFTIFWLRRFPKLARPFSYLFQIVQFYRNAQRLLRTIKKINPAAIVIGSHLGGVYIRVLQKYCYERSIPIISMWITEDSLRNSMLMPRWFPVTKSVRNIIEWKPHNKYTQNNLFSVSGNALKRHLVNMGIEKEQVIVTGNPAHDVICDTFSENRNILLDQGLVMKGRYIVLLTEVIHEIYDLTYLNQLLEVLKDAFNLLPGDIKVVVKYHPRETNETKNIHKEKLHGSRYVFIEDIDLITLSRDAAISIGHFSKALESSFIVGTPVLSINLFNNEAHSIYGYSGKLMECVSPKEVSEKLLQFFEDEAFYNYAHTVTQEWCKDNVNKLDGKSASRVANVILKHCL